MKCANCCFEFTGGLFCPECGVSVNSFSDDAFRRQNGGETKEAAQGKKSGESKDESARQGRHKKTVPNDFQRVYTQWKNGEMTATSAMKILGMSKSSFYREVAKQKQ